MGYLEETVNNQLQKAEAAIQTAVADFLAMKGKILPFKSSPDKAIKQRADALYNRQVQLEAEMQNAMADINKIKEGINAQGTAFLIAEAGSVADIYETAKDIKTHMDEVNGFLGTTPLKSPVVTKNAITWLAVGAGLLGLVVYRKRF